MEVLEQLAYLLHNIHRKQHNLINQCLEKSEKYIQITNLGLKSPA